MIKTYFVSALSNIEGNINVEQCKSNSSCFYQIKYEKDKYIL